ncbi:phage tail protein [Wolbachia endosymbiont (group B) of Camptogramma bilineatum]|uniref:phage tail protein n=1 Tax=Wolbachia endosymbiont (group B) of Camptogramma bilineatum TaxID=2953991 RepID=UPI0022327360|nr:phage tail protein [Wolbachia endosymbiont (group B) of Camptogramma bilineatum]
MWTDCHNWQTGHWIQGKISQLNVSDVLSDLLQKVGLKGDQFDTSDVKGLLSGYVINDQQPVRSIIKMLRRCYFFDVVEQNSKLKFIQKGRGVKTEIPIGEMVTNNVAKLVNISQLDLNSKVNVVYFNRNFGYPIDVKYAELPKQGNAATVPIPLIMEEGEAQNIAEVLLYSSWQERNVYNFKLPIKYAWLLPSDVIAISDGEKRHTMRIIKTKFESMSIQVMGVGYDPSIYKLSFPSTRSLMLKEYPPSRVSKSIVEMIDLPYIKGNIASFTLISEEEGWKGATLFISYDDKNYKPIASANIQSTYGYVIEFTDEGITVVLRFGKIDVMSPTVLALVGKEVIKFERAKLIGKNKYQLIDLIRGQEGTKKYEHTTGEKFILLDDSIISFEVQKGRKFYLKAVTYGDSLENTKAKLLIKNFS